MSLSDIQKRLREVLKKAGYSLNEKEPLLEQIDSLQVVNLLDLIENEFGIEIESFEVRSDNFISLEKLSFFISQKTNLS